MFWKVRVQLILCSTNNAVQIYQKKKAENHAIHPLQCPLPITITSIPYQHHQNTLYALVISPYNTLLISSFGNKFVLI